MDKQDEIAGTLKLLKYNPERMVRRRGFEPRTHCLESSCYFLLSYRRYNSGSGKHSKTSICALAAGFCAMFAVFMLMPGTLLCTGPANIHTEPALLLVIFAVHAHKLGRKPTNRGTLNICFNAVSHHVDIRFFKARRCTVITGSGTFVACSYTFLQSSIHIPSPYFFILKH